MLSGHPVTFSIFVSVGFCRIRAGFHLFSHICSFTTGSGFSSSGYRIHSLFPFPVFSPLSPFLYRTRLPASHYNMRDESDVYIKGIFFLEVYPREKVSKLSLILFVLWISMWKFNSNIWHLFYHSSFCPLMLTYMPIFTPVVPAYIDRAAVYSRRRWMINKCRNVEGHGGKHPWDGNVSSRQGWIARTWSL